ncbi:hypothetical protein [Enhydrobacter sp.]|uniref:hypothetical protein n=1 Tax=Enhydrobacter sp. TaxID=1894999 RepID=UPI00260E78C4|nr:hypothetical protein [Enhydrobacter sp.]
MADIVNAVKCRQYTSPAGRECLEIGQGIGWSSRHLLDGEENAMTINETYYLVTVCVAFAGLGLFLAAETLLYRRSLRRTGGPAPEK